MLPSEIVRCIVNLRWREPTETQLAVLDFIRSHRAENQMPPTRAEISNHFGWRSANAANEHLIALQLKGIIILKPGISRGVFVVGD